MTYTKLSIILFTLLFLGCNDAGMKITAANETSTDEDKEKLTQLVKQLYQWHETKSSNDDFDVIPDEQDSMYIALNQPKHEERMIELKKTAFFTDQFLDNYNKIAWTIDQGLKNKELEYFVGYVPPYGNDANPWCNCQDSPSDNYWEIITIDKLSIDKNSASFIWTWGYEFEYEVKAIQENNTWKITYLQGFDFDQFFPSR